MLGEEFGLNHDADLKGIKIAKVMSNEDPKLQERVLIQVLGMHNIEDTSLKNAIWANHCAPFRDSAGDLPEPGDYIYVMFPNDVDFMSVIWLGFVKSSFQGGSGGTKVEKPTQDRFGNIEQVTEE